MAVLYKNLRDRCQQQRMFDAYQQKMMEILAEITPTTSMQQIEPSFIAGSISTLHFYPNKNQAFKTWFNRYSNLLSKDVMDELAKSTSQFR